MSCHRYVQRGALRLTLNDENGALRDFEMAQQLNPNNVDSLICAAPLKNKYRSGIVALKDCNAAVELAPNKARCYVTRGGVHFSMSNTKQALEDYDHAIRYPFFLFFF